MSAAAHLNADNLWWIYPALIAGVAAGAGLGWLINWTYQAVGRRT